MDKKLLAEAYNKAFFGQDGHYGEDSAEAYVLQAPLCAYFRGMVETLEVLCRKHKTRKKRSSKSRKKTSTKR